MKQKLTMGIASLLALAVSAIAPSLAQAETQTLVSSEASSLCINPTAPGFEPLVKGEPNYAPLFTPHEGPFPDTGEACGEPLTTHATAMAGPGESAYPYSSSIPGASWISLNKTGEDASNPAPKYYIYDATFTLCANQPDNTEINGKMFADNTAGAFLNGEPLGHQAFGLPPSNHENFSGTPFAFGGPSHHGFKVGLNTLQIVVYDESAPYTATNFSATVTSKETCGSFEFPGLGRCIKVLKGKGKFNDSGCEKTIVGNGRFEWIGGGAIKNHFTSAEAVSTIETTKKTKVVCRSATDTGEYLGESEDREKMVFHECESGGLKCHSAGAAEGELTTSELRSLYGFIKRPKSIGVSLEALSGAFMEFECAGLKMVIKGSVIAPITPISKMATKFTEKFAQAKGKQKPEKFEGEPKDTLECSIAGGPFEQCGLRSTDTITNEEALEIREAA